MTTSTDKQYKTIRDCLEAIIDNKDVPLAAVIQAMNAKDALASIQEAARL